MTERLDDSGSNDKPRASFTPLTEKQIEYWRAWHNKGDTADFYAGAFDVLCDMAVNSLLYAEEIERLRTRSAGTRILDDAEIIAAFSNGGGPADHIPTHQPHAPLLTNEQIIWVVRRFRAGAVVASSDTVTVPRELTAENGAKAALIGEFSFWMDCCQRNVTVPWDTLKEIHREVVKRFGTPHSASPINLEGHAGDANDVGSMIAAGITRAAAATDRLITINNIERFHAGEERLEPDPDGPWVRFSDAAAISNRLASATRSATEPTFEQLRAAHARMRKALDDIYNHNEATRAAVIQYYGLWHDRPARERD